jgi:crotonobetainyl-CoA:carnitine CoA-transferase CaiB-like acyl-CoA transferase
LFYADPVAGIHGAIAVMAALEHRRKTGEGQWIDLSLNEGGASFCFESLLAYQATGEIQPPRANRDLRFAPQGAYPAIGVDKWVAISVQDDGDWPKLCSVIGREDLGRDPELATLRGRQRRHDELDAAISEWTRTLEQYQVARAMQDMEISAAPVLANWQMLPDPHLHARGFFVDIEHPVVGVYPHASWPWRFSRTPAAVTKAAPLFSQHTREVLAEMGLSADQIDDLYETGIAADVPVAR